MSNAPIQLSSIRLHSTSSHFIRHERANSAYTETSKKYRCIQYLMMSYPNPRIRGRDYSLHMIDGYIGQETLRHNSRLQSKNTWSYERLMAAYITRRARNPRKWKRRQRVIPESVCTYIFGGDEARWTCRGPRDLFSLICEHTISDTYRIAVMIEQGEQSLTEWSKIIRATGLTGHKRYTRRRRTDTSRRAGEVLLKVLYESCHDLNRPARELISALNVPFAFSADGLDSEEE